MGKPLFTVNIATYNQLPSLKVVLEALSEQTFQDFEVIVTDDGSSDGTKEWAKDKGFTYLWQPDEGFRIAKSKNMGINKAKGKFFVSLEADVIPNKMLLEEYSKHLKDNRIILGVRHDIEALPTHLDFEQMDKDIVSYDWRMDRLMQLDKSKMPWRECSGCNVLLPLESLLRVGGWNENFKHYGIDDYEVCLRMLMDGCEIIALTSAYGYHIKHELRQTVPDNIKLLTDLEEKYESSN